MDALLQSLPYMQNEKQIINSHNKTALNSIKTKEKRGKKNCNCRDKKILSSSSKRKL